MKALSAKLKTAKQRQNQKSNSVRSKLHKKKQQIT